MDSSDQNPDFFRRETMSVKLWSHTVAVALLVMTVSAWASEPPSEPQSEMEWQT